MRLLSVAAQVPPVYAIFWTSAFLHKCRRRRRSQPGQCWRRIFLKRHVNRVYCCHYFSSRTIQVKFTMHWRLWHAMMQGRGFGTSASLCRIFYYYARFRTFLLHSTYRKNGTKKSRRRLRCRGVQRIAAEIIILDSSKQTCLHSIFVSNFVWSSFRCKGGNLVASAATA